MKGLNPNDDVTLVAASLQGDQESIMLVGHLPHLSRLVSLLVTGDPEIEIVRFRNAGIVCLSQQDGKWAIDWVMQPDFFGKRDNCGQHRVVRLLGVRPIRAYP